MIEVRTLRRVLLILFTLSGFSGLIYESIWTHYLKLMLGHAAHAQTLVLAIFMGGMAAGAWLAGRFSERWGNPLAAYAAVEGAVGLFALGFHGLFTRALDWLYAHVLPATDGLVAAGVAKWTLAALLILPPSVLLGTTFPLMSAAILRACPQRSGATLALLYFTNSLGACVGVLASGFLLVPWSGLPGTLLIAGMINLTLAAAVWTLGRGTASRPLPVRATRVGGGGVPALLWLAALLTGAASFFYEIGWIRMLSLVLGTTAQSFELMLSAFILGLALGGLWIRRRIDRLDSPLRFAGHVQVLMGAFALLTLPLYGATFDFMALLLGQVDKTEGGWVLFNAGSHVIALAVMLPATVMAGMTLPLFTFALLARGCGERSIGRIYAANTIGAIVGVLLAVHVVMPAIGTKGLILCGAGVDVVLGLVLLGAVRRRLRSRELVAAAAAAAVLFAAVGLGVRPDLRRTASGVYRYGTSELPGGAEVVFHRDGKTATIDLIRERDGTLKISTNGKPDARIAVASEIPAPDEITMVMLAAVPLALHPEARTAAIVGLGSGLTTHTLLGADTLERVDTIEIEAAVLDAARGFGPSVERVWSDPRSRLHVEDAKAFLSSRGRRYDLIVSEPSNPWVSGVASLFSEEFYRHATRHLEEDGLLVQWLQLYEINVDLLASVFKALSASFDDYTVFSADNANVVVAATNGGNLDRLDPTLFDPPRLRRDLARVGLKRIEDLELRRIGSRRLLHPVFAASGAPANSDYFPYLSLRAPRSRFLDENAVDLTRLHVAPVPVTEMLDPRVRRSPEPHSGDGSFSPARARRLAGQLVGSLAAPQAAASHDAGRPTWYRGLQASCVDPVPDEAALRDDLTWLAAATNPYVRGPELGRMWDRVASLVCEDRLSPRTRDWLRLHRAVADRDAPAMARIAGGLLQAAGDPPTRREVEYLLAAGMTGALAAGDREQASRLARRGAPLYPPGANPPFYLRLLLLQALGQST